jgi:hypothetical protein
MSNYRLVGPKPARMYEVILPKKLGYFGKVQEVLEDLFDEQAVRDIPFVTRTLAERQASDPQFNAESWLKSLCQATRGYSIYEMDGRFLGTTGPVDERVLVIRFIFHNPTPIEGEPPESDLLAASMEVVNYLVAHRFAAELDVEEEIWCVEFSNPQLFIWKKQNRPV